MGTEKSNEEIIVLRNLLLKTALNDIDRRPGHEMMNASIMADVLHYCDKNFKRRIWIIEETMRYQYCPQCGRKLIPKPAGDDGLVPYCEACSKFWFDSFGSCVIIMVVNERNEVAMLRQHYMSDEYMNFISGYITVGETAEEAARREVREEIGIDLEELEYSGTWWFGEQELLMHGYIGRARSQDFVLSKEVDAAQWIPLEELRNYMYPDSPGNAQYGTYRVFLERYSSK